MNKKCVVLYSGGLDSTTCIAIAQSEGYEVFALSFDYEQKQRSELEFASKMAKEQGINHRIVNIQDIGAFGGSALTDANIDVPDFEGDGEIPSTYVPARNTIFLSIGLGYAEVVKANKIFIGASSVDYSGYPDCRPEYFDCMKKLASLATKVGVEGNGIEIETPLIYLSKAETIKLGLSLGADYANSVSCYQANGNGEACGKCDSCHLRKKGFEEADVKDPTRYYA